MGIPFVNPFNEWAVAAFVPAYMHDGHSVDRVYRRSAFVERDAESAHGSGEEVASNGSVNRD